MNRGFGLIEILIALVVVAAAGTLLYTYFKSTTRTMETIKEQAPLAGAKVAVLAILPAPPRFQCLGNDFEYDGATGSLTLLIANAGDCR